MRELKAAGDAVVTTVMTMVGSVASLMCAAPAVRVVAASRTDTRDAGLEARARRRIAMMALVVLASAMLATTSAAADDGVNLLKNGSFEEPVGGFQLIDASESMDKAQWATTDSAIEIWPSDWSPFPTHGDQFLELNAYSNGAIYQDVATIPNQVLTWSLHHSARSSDIESAAVLIGPSGGIGVDGLLTQDPLTWNGNPVAPGTAISDPVETWGLWSGSYVVPAGQTSTRFAVQAVTSQWSSFGNLLDDVRLIEGQASTTTPLSSPSPSPAPVVSILSFQALDGSCGTSRSASGTNSSWVQLPGADQCARTGKVLLGWSTSPDFPVDVAKAHVDRSMGAIDDYFNGMRMIFIPAGGYALVSGDNTLYPIWSA